MIKRNIKYYNFDALKCLKEKEKYPNYKPIKKQLPNTMNLTEHKKSFQILIKW